MNLIKDLWIQSVDLSLVPLMKETRRRRAVEEPKSQNNQNPADVRNWYRQRLSAYVISRLPGGDDMIVNGACSSEDKLMIHIMCN